MLYAIGMDAKKPGRERALEITQADGSPIGDVPPAHLGGGGGGNGGGGYGAAPGYAAGGYSGAPARGNTSMAGKSAGTVKIWNDEKGFGFIDPSGTRSTATSRALIAVGCVCSPCAMPGGNMLTTCTAGMHANEQPAQVAARTCLCTAPT